MQVQSFAVHAENHDRLHGSVRGAEPVRRPRAEFDGFARLDGEIPLAEDEPHSAGQHVGPVLPFVNGQLRGRGKSDWQMTGLGGKLAA